MKIYAWEFLGDKECMIADSYKESWDRLSQDMRDYLSEDDGGYHKSNCKVVEIKDEKFMAYDVWEL